MTDFKAIQNEVVQSWSVDHSADCAVVLTGGSGRIREGFDLLANKKIKKLIISGVNTNVQLRELLPMWPFYGTLSENDVILEKRSETTFGNAQQSLPIVEALKCRDLILVTSRQHMHRAYKTFRASFPAEIYIYPRAVVSGRYETTSWDILVETLKTLFYSTWAY